MPFQGIRKFEKNDSKKPAPANRGDAFEASLQHQEASQHGHRAHKHASFLEFYFYAPILHPPVPIKHPLFFNNCLI